MPWRHVTPVPLYSEEHCSYPVRFWLCAMSLCLEWLLVTVAVVWYHTHTIQGDQYCTVLYCTVLYCTIQGLHWDCDTASCRGSREDRTSFVSFPALASVVRLEGTSKLYCGLVPGLQRQMVSTVQHSTVSTVQYSVGCNRCSLLCVSGCTSG